MQKDKKLLIIAYSLGRTGSSATMGLTNILGYSSHGKSNLIAKSAMNPKGFFELKDHNQLLSKIYGKQIFPGIQYIPTVKELEKKAKNGNKLYLEYIEKEFYNVKLISIKSPRCLLLPLIKIFQNRYSIKIIFLTRDESKQVNSIYRVWQSKKLLRSHSKSFIRNWLKSWKKISEELLDSGTFDYIRISFEELIANKIDTAYKIADFINMPRPNKDLIDEWLDDKLVNRTHYEKKNTHIYTKLKLKLNFYRLKISRFITHN